ncbi:MAG: hypothetical protein ACK5XA_15735 [Tagaea sp.]
MYGQNAFLAGFNMLDSVYRQREEQARFDEEKKFRNEQRNWAREDRAREQKKVKAYEDAGRTLTADAGTAIGETGNRVFARDAATAAALADQEASVAELEGRAPAQSAAALAVGGKLFDNADTAQRAVRRGNTPQGRLQRLSEAAFSVGDAAQGAQFEQTARQIQKEGYKDALDTLFRTGSAKAAQDFFDAQGDERVDGELQATPVERVMADGQKVRDFTLAIKRKDGTVEPVGSALEMRMNADDPTKWTAFMRQGKSEARADQSLDLQGRQVTNTERATDASIANQAATLNLREREVDASIENQRAMRRLEGTRLSIAQSAEARAAASDKFKKNGGEIAAKITATEKILGRALTSEERLGMLGLTKGDGTAKFVDEIIQEGVKAGTVAPADAPKLRVTMRNEIVRQQDVLTAEVALAQVKASGALTPALLDEFRKKTGLNDDWLRARGYIDARGNLIGYVDPTAAPRAASQAAALAESQAAVQNAPPARPIAPRGLGVPR